MIARTIITTNNAVAKSVCPVMNNAHAMIIKAMIKQPTGSNLRDPRTVGGGPTWWGTGTAKSYTQSPRDLRLTVSSIKIASLRCS